MTTRAASLVRWTKHTVRGTPLVCFPWAGAGAAVFREWASWLDEHVEVWAARLPARESRILEAPVSDLTQLAREFADAIERVVGRDPVLLGHCSGALLAYETVVELRQRGRLRASQLMVIAQRAPSTVSARPAVENLDDELRRLGYVDDRILADAEMMALLRPALDADFRMSAEFCYRGGRRLDIPVSVFAGRHDASIDPHAARAWEHETTGTFELAELDGDHLFTGSSRRALATAVGERIARSPQLLTPERTR
jgi:medium-chain acyl-[acyl-carrier-protein] hydrolase